MVQPAEIRIKNSPLSYAQLNTELKVEVNPFIPVISSSGLPTKTSDKTAFVLIVVFLPPYCYKPQFHVCRQK